MRLRVEDVLLVVDVIKPLYLMTTKALSHITSMCPKGCASVLKTYFSSGTV